MNDNLTRAERVATEQANEMRRQLEHSTPAELGWPGLTAEQLIAAEYKCWLVEELNEDRKAAERNDWLKRGVKGRA
jgi:hypothetical protein